MSEVKNYYSAEVKSAKLSYYAGLNEKGQRHFLGLEYECLGRGSQRYLAQVYGCSRNRITSGKRELDALKRGESSSMGTRQRKVGGGAKKKK